VTTHGFLLMWLCTNSWGSSKGSVPPKGRRPRIRESRDQRENQPINLPEEYEEIEAQAHISELLDGILDAEDLRGIDLMLALVEPESVECVHW